MNPLELATAYQGSAVVAAACRSGVADAIAHGPRQPEAVAAACGTHPRATRGLLGALAALGLADHRPDGYALSPAGAELASDHPGSVALIVAKEWFFYQAWAGLDASVRDGHARIPPWRERLAGDPGRALDFLRALDDLAARFGGELPALAGLRRPGRLLDVGGGAGSHAANLVRHVPGLRATVLDLPPVEAVVRERHPELAFVAGDLDLPRFGRPRGEQWEVVLLANVLHDHPADRCRRIVAEAAGLLPPGGVLLVYEWLLDDGGDTPAAVALFDLMMLVENDGGAAWTEAELRGWLLEAGLQPAAAPARSPSSAPTRQDHRDLAFTTEGGQRRGSDLDLAAGHRPAGRRLGARARPPHVGLAGSATWASLMASVHSRSPWRPTMTWWGGGTASRSPAWRSTPSSQAVCPAARASSSRLAVSRSSYAAHSRG